MIKVCVIGASGFVGRALIERLLNRDGIELITVIHSPGNAWPIMRFDIPFVIADLSDTESLDRAIDGCTHVVNLTLGQFENMVDNLKNLVKVCKRHNVKRLIHLSSVTVYGDFPHSSSEQENGPPLAKKNTYGWFKRKQDEVIETANKDGLSCVTLCPPHITGPYGRIFHQVIESIRQGSFALVDNGVYPCNIVDINNLCKSIELSFYIEITDGKRIFVTNGDEYTWKDLAVDASRLAGVDFSKIPSISKVQALSLGNRKLSIYGFAKATIKIPEVQKLAGETVLVKNRKIFGLIKKISSGFLKERISVNKIQTTEQIDLSTLNPGLCIQQLRGVRHKIDRARIILDYNPEVSSSQSFELFKDYYKKLYGFDTEYWAISIR